MGLGGGIVKVGTVSKYLNTQVMGRSDTYRLGRDLETCLEGIETVHAIGDIGVEAYDR